MSFTRADRSVFSEWWYTIDKAMLALVVVLIGAGFVLSLAASPAVAIKKGLSVYHFTGRHLIFTAVGTAAMLGASMLLPREVRRAALLIAAVGFGLMLSIHISAPEINGAKRWVIIGGFSLQPSELTKPGFIVLSAWLMAESRERTEMPAMPIAIGLLAVFSVLLLSQPDVGQMVLVLVVWSTMLFLSGHPVLLAGATAGVGAAGFVFAYLSFDHVRQRIGRFIDPSTGDTFQVDRALQSFSEGGLMGRGPGQGTIKTVLPDAHTDFIFAVLAEEYGALACLALLGLFALLFVRSWSRMRSEPDLFAKLGIAGLSLMLLVQALINMGVNVGIFPAKGMTLPFISYGGSSLVSSALTMGFLLALMRRRPDAAHAKRPQVRSRSGPIEV